MNDRSQGGSSLFNGQIELMQHRRIPADDSRGMGQWMDEKDANGNGIRVPATYYLQLFNRADTKPMQRIVQQKVDNPAQYFFNFNITKVADRSQQGDLREQLINSNIVDSMRLTYFPLDSESILLRIINLDDWYNARMQSNTVHVETIA